MGRLLLALALFIFGCPAAAETITLRSGSRIEGTILKMDESKVVIRTSEMGKLSVKRGAVKSIVQEGAENPEDDENIDEIEEEDDTETETLEPSNRKKKDNVWKPGLIGRIGGGISLTSLQINGKRPSKGLFSEVSQPGYNFHWDMLGYRWDSGASLSLFGDGADFDKARGYFEYQRSISNVGLRLDYQFLQTSEFIGSRAYFRLGASLGSASFTIDKLKEGFDPDTANEYDDYEEWAAFYGTSFGLDLGFDIISEYFGITVGVAGFVAKLSDAELTDEALKGGMGVYADRPMQPIVATGMLYCGLLYNFDL